MIAFKFLGAGALAPFTGFAWRAGEWVESPGALDAGVYACRPRDLAYWANDELWRAELDGETHEDDIFVVARRGRIVERIDAWNERTAAEYRAACVWHARDVVVAALRASADAQRAAALEAARDFEALAKAASGGDPAGPAAYLVVAAGCVGRADLTHGTSFVACRAAVASANDPKAFQAERAWQSHWLAEKLKIDARA